MHCTCRAVDSSPSSTKSTSGGGLHADLHCIEEVGIGKFAHDNGNVSTDVESSVNMVRHEFPIGFLSVSFGERLIYIVILPGELLVRRDIISLLGLWTLTPITDMPLEMMQVAILRAICKP